MIKYSVERINEVKKKYEGLQLKCYWVNIYTPVNLWEHTLQEIIDNETLYKKYIEYLRTPFNNTVSNSSIYKIVFDFQWLPRHVWNLQDYCSERYQILL